MREQVEAVIDEYVRPLVEADGGVIEIETVTREEVVLRVGGACAGCPGVHVTRTRVIEPLLSRALGRPVKVTTKPAAPRR